MLTVEATEGPLHIARDCLGNRQRRIDYDLVQVMMIITMMMMMIIICNDNDLVQDGAEKELLKEIELISGVQVTEISSACSLIFAKAKNIKSCGDSFSYNGR